MKKILIIVIAVIVVGGGAFYGGMKYAQNKTSSGFGQGGFKNFSGLSPEERQQQFKDTGAGFKGARMGGGLINGEVIAQGDKNITVKLKDGGSKIVFYSDATEVDKLVSSNLGDVQVGAVVLVSGQTNSDGSITAQSIQLRSDAANP